MKLPPYGLVDSNLLAAGGQRPIPDWSGSEKEYNLYFESLLDEISDSIWPVFDREKAAWSGKARKFMKRATRRELQFMRKTYQVNDLLSALPNYAPDVTAPYRKTHDWHFRIEDNLRIQAGTEPVGITTNPSLIDELASHHGKLAMNYICYEPAANPLNIHQTFITGAYSKTDGLFEYKERFQRPRPYQTALILGETQFVHHAAASGIHFGNHPSLVSGHCYQGILLACATLESWIDSGEDTSERVERLAQFGVDFGDRRVYGGVHYPTDNIASWVVSLKFIPRIFKHSDRILRFAQDAIVAKSLLYRTIKNTYEADSDLNRSLVLLNKYLPKKPSSHYWHS